jgi:hypothetical protein
MNPQPPLITHTKYLEKETWLNSANNNFKTWTINSRAFVRNTLKENTIIYPQLKYQQYFVSNYQNKLLRKEKFTYKSAPVQKETIEIPEQIQESCQQVNRIKQQFKKFQLHTPNLIK